MNNHHLHSPHMLALMGYELAKDGKNLRKGIEMCNKALADEPANLENYLYLGKLLLVAGKKEQAIKVFRAGLKIRKDHRLTSELTNLGIRKPPPLPSLPRSHKLNIAIGKMLALLKLR